MVSTHPCSSFKPNKMCSRRTLSRAFLEVSERLLSVPTFMTGVSRSQHHTDNAGSLYTENCFNIRTYMFNRKMAGLQKQVEWYEIAQRKVTHHMKRQTTFSMMHYFHKTENSALVRRQHFTSTVGQVFTANWCAENRTVKYKTPWICRQRASKLAGGGNVTW